MTPLPKKKSTKSRTGQRRNANKTILPGLVVCSSCKSLKYPHKACGKCGFYR